MFATLLGLLLVVAPPPHDNSSSQSLVDVRADGLVAQLRVQAESVLELPGVDPDQNGWLDPDEFEAARDQIRAHLRENWVLRADSPEAPPLALQLERLELVEQGRSALDLARFVEVEWSWSGEPPARLELEMTLFSVTSPMHIDTCRVVWPDDSYRDARTWGGQPRASFEALAAPRAPTDAGAEATPRGQGPSFLVDLRLGVEHMLGGWDHLAFLLGLLVLCQSLRALLGLVTAFTLAHSLTLALAAYEVVRLPGAPVELVIGLSIAYVGARGLILKEPGAPWLEAGAFGLVHGLGFASQLARQLEASASPLQLLLGFNLGLELGQLLVVVALLLLVTLLRLRPPAVPGARRALLPRNLGRLASLGVLLAGLFWSYERFGAVFG